MAVGWVGIEIVQLLLGLIGLSTDDAGLVRATHVVMEILGIELIAVIAWTTLLTGLLLATATQCGLLKQYWIVTKLVVNIALMLNGHFFLQHWLRQQAEAGKATESLSLQLVISIGTALVMLVSATALSVYKPWGKTRRGRRPAPKSSCGPAHPPHGSSV
ncbi:membrane protein [Streptomyces coeruleoprunus]